jgi:methylenetetrahydrofolate dehydrogenase (NADP+)/methenyltetrahydrofolate cyclohydrolase
MTAMSARSIDGKLIAQRIRDDLATEVARITELYSLTPGLATILVGDDPASQGYVRSKNNACRKIGMYSEQYTFSATITQDELLETIRALNANKKIHGILVQLPLPKQLNERAVIKTINPAKDVDGIHPTNLGALLVGDEGFKPCTPLGIQQLLIHAGIETAGAHVVVVGRSAIVGKPIAAMLMQKDRYANATVTVCHSRTPNLAAITRQADILIAAIGRPEFITAEMVKEGATVIDVGINRVDDPSTEKGYRLVGDVKFDEVAATCGAITPAPGGVGPMTIAMLLYNTILAAKKIAGIHGAS